MNKTQDKNQTNAEKGKIKPGTDKTAIDKGTDRRGNAGNQGGKSGTVLGKINSDAKKEPK